MAVFTLRYAHALEQVVAEKRLDSAAVLQQLKDFAGTFDGSAQLREILMDPSILKEQKLKVLDAIAAKIGMLPQVRNLIAVITDHQRSMRRSPTRMRDGRMRRLRARAR
jgi:F-type H+-transporting ATPase subunit delta